MFKNRTGIPSVNRHAAVFGKRFHLLSIATLTAMILICPSGQATADWRCPAPVGGKAVGCLLPFDGVTVQNELDERVTVTLMAANSWSEAEGPANAKQHGEAGCSVRVMPAPREGHVCPKRWATIRPCKRIRATHVCIVVKQGDVKHGKVMAIRSSPRELLYFRHVKVRVVKWKNSFQVHTDPIIARRLWNTLEAGTHRFDFHNDGVVGRMPDKEFREKYKKTCPAWTLENLPKPMVKDKGRGQTTFRGFTLMNMMSENNAVKVNWRIINEWDSGWTYSTGPEVLATADDHAKAWDAEISYGPRYGPMDQWESVGWGDSETIKPKDAMNQLRKVRATTVCIMTQVADGPIKTTICSCDFDQNNLTFIEELALIVSGPANDHEVEVMYDFAKRADLTQDKDDPEFDTLGDEHEASSSPSTIEDTCPGD